ncbi:MAG: TetR/AcrR family transcriptional regulator [Syntrophaceae bacterium]|nr:TetR/AcrR family transcriptional regulator [Syntrophaceae bacterium]
MKNRKEKSDKTTERILAAARTVFAEKGYSGAHIDAIADRAGVNKATIYYQIGDKDTLYAHVIHQVLGNTAQNIAQVVASAQNPEEKLKAYIAFIADTVDKNPELPSIMMREVASGGVTMPRVVMEDIASVLAILACILDEGKKRGVFIETVPFLIHMMIMGTILFYKKASPIKDKQSWIPAALKAHDKKLKSSLGEEVAALILKAIKR